MRVKAGFTADIALRLRPHQFPELRRHAGFIHERVAYIDVKLKSNGEAFIEQAGGDEDALRVARINIAMAGGSLRRRAVKVLCDESFVTIANSDGHKVKSFALQRRGNWARHGADDPLKIVGREHDFARGGIADTVGRLVDSRIANNLLRGAELRIDCLTHAIILTYS